jgi:hypothetical protein
MSSCRYMKRNYTNNKSNDDKETRPNVANVGNMQKGMMMTGQSPPVNGSLDIHQYSFNELLDVFDLSPNLTVDDLKRTRKQVLSLHPDKNRSVSVEHYMFFKNAYELIESYYAVMKKQNVELPSEEILYDPEYIPKNKTIETEIGKMSKNDFNEKFNTLFVNNVKMGGDNEPDRLKWFKEENTTYEPITNAKDIHNTFEKIRNNKSGLVVYNGEFRPLHGATRNIGGESFYDEKETDEHGYITCNPFDKLKYDDITRVHRDQVIIPVESNEFVRANQQRVLDEYKREPDYKMMEKQQATYMLEQQKLQQENIIREKQHNLQKKISTYEQINDSIRSQFMVLK